MKINVPVSIGELVDKSTILEIKSVKIDNHKKNQEIHKEKTLLQEELKKNNPYGVRLWIPHWRPLSIKSRSL